MMTKTNVHISNIRQGDMIEHNGVIKTVSSKDIKKSNFMGLTIFGDSYNIGHKPVIKIVKYENN